MHDVFGHGWLLRQALGDALEHLVARESSAPPVVRCGEKSERLAFSVRCQKERRRSQAIAFSHLARSPVDADFGATGMTIVALDHEQYARRLERVPRRLLCRTPYRNTDGGYVLATASGGRVLTVNHHPWYDNAEDGKAFFTIKVRSPFHDPNHHYNHFSYHFVCQVSPKCMDATVTLWPEKCRSSSART